MAPEQIKALRTALGRTQSQFASDLSLSLRALACWESDAPGRKPTGPALILLHLLDQKPALFADVQKIAAKVARKR